MVELNEIYNTKLLELAADIPHSERLAAPDASVTAHSKLCGSTVSVDLKMAGDRVTNYGQSIKACLLGQSAASIVGREIIGASAKELRKVRDEMHRMLKENGPPPTGRFAELEVLEPVRHYKARHGSVMLVFDAVVEAVNEIEKKHADAAASVRQP